MRLELKSDDIAYPNGLEVAIEGFASDTGGIRPSQVFVEVYEGNLRVHVWNGDDEGPTVSVTIPPLPPPSPAVGS
jgi:hypothetical protein